jgi:hypothetical protein
VNWGVGAVGQIYVLANLAIAAGYLAVPFLVLPFLPLRRSTLVFGAVFFLGCTGSHMDMVLDVLFRWGHHPPVSWVDAVWHVGQAIGTWGFILLFRAELAKAKRLLEAAEQEVVSGPGDGA